MSVYSAEIRLETQGNDDIHDISEAVSERVEESGIKNGIVNVCVIGSTASVTTIENESGLRGDIKELLEELIPSSKDWRHNSTWDEGNGHAHLRASLIGPSLTIPFIDSKMTLGTWQQIVFIDSDVKPRSRRLIVQVIGE
jgi:secondary thiamine-phosphate synthase enzyme